VTGCEHLRPAIGAYVLGRLDPDEAAAVRRHLHECPECAAEYDSLAPLPNLLSLAGGAEQATAEPLSPAFEERLLDAYARDHRTPARRRPFWRRRPRWAALAAAGAVAAAAAVAIVVIGGEDAAAPRYGVSFRAIDSPGAKAGARLESRDAGTTLHLWVAGLPRDQKAVYEVLCDAKTWTASAGTFHTGPDGRTYVVLNTAMRRGEYDGIRIVRRTRRPDGRVVRREVLAARLS
jgi:anti-sigma-K factor RskA